MPARGNHQHLQQVRKLGATPTHVHGGIPRIQGNIAFNFDPILRVNSVRAVIKKVQGFVH